MIPFWIWAFLLAGAGVGFISAMFGVGAIIGATITSYAPGWIMKILFGIVCLIGAWRFLTAKPKPVEEIPKLSMVKGFGWGLIAATFAAFIGIGGGLVYVPPSKPSLGFPMHLSILFSLAMIVISSGIGSISYAFWGLQIQNAGNTIFPPYSIGYFNYGAFLTLGVTSAVFSIFGATVSEKTKPRVLRIALGLLYIYIGLKMLGLPI